MSDECLIDHRSSFIDFERQFADWLMQPAIVKQRLADDPNDHELRTYYHWIADGIDFINLDNASADMFDDAQVKWIERITGEIRFEFRNVSMGDVPADVAKRYTHHLVEQCFNENRSMLAPEPVDCDRNVVCAPAPNGGE